MSLRKLSRMEMRWASATLIAIFPAPAKDEACKMPLGIADLDIDGYLTGTFARIPLEPAIGLRAAIWIAALAPLFVLGRLATITGLSAAERSDLLSRLIASPIYAVRQLVIALKAVGAMLYAGAPVVRAAMLAKPRASMEPISLRLGFARTAASEPHPAKVASDARKTA